MDFRRIETIFLIVFVALNIFLGMTFFQNQQVDLATAGDATSEVLQDIKRDDIKLPKLSATTREGSYLASTNASTLQADAAPLAGQSLRFSKTDGTTLTATLQNPLTVKSNVANRLKRWVTEGNVIHGEVYVYAPQLSSASAYVFAQKIGGHLFYDDRAQLTLHVANHRLTGYTQTYLPSATTLRANVALCSAQDAVTTLYRENEIANNSTVKWTRLAYTYLLDAKGSTVYIPAWFVGIESQGSKNLTVKKVNAINKTVLKARVAD